MAKSNDTKKKTKTGNATKGAPRKKRGQESHFKGARLQFMTEQVPAYIAASKKKGTKEFKTEGLTAFWSEFFDEYWKKFPWRLSLKEELDPNTLVAPPPQTAADAFEALGLNLSKEESDMKSEIQSDEAAVKQKIKRWFVRQRPGAMGIQGNPYFEHLAQLSRGNSSSALQRPADYQFYMQHEDYKDAVTERFEDKCREEGTAKLIALRCAIAKKMFEAESDDVKNQIKAECDKRHAEQLEAYKDEDESLPSPDPEVQEQ
ncbi:hypothetical protein K438DRAFT_1751012 [Mycena galopus ATCC 62051]|nr:hypothetical protein K438DRAFT_1751012 [Mycena galopus ATCC 62051]